MRFVVRRNVLLCCKFVRYNVLLFAKRRGRSYFYWFILYASYGYSITDEKILINFSSHDPTKLLLDITDNEISRNKWHI